MSLEEADDQIEFIASLSGQPEKLQAVYRYVECKEQRFDGDYDIDPWDYMDEHTRTFDNTAFKEAIKHQRTTCEKYEHEFKESIRRLDQLGIDHMALDVIGLTSSALSEIKRLFQQPTEMNSIDKKQQPGSEEPLRKLPILRIHDTDFYVDLAKLEFRQVDNASNAISFYDVQDNNDHTVVMYDMKTKNAFKGTWGEMTAREDVIPVRLPAAVDLDFEYVMSKLNERSAQLHFERQQKNNGATTINNDKNKKQSRGPGL